MMMKIFLLFLIIGSALCLDRQRDCKCRVSTKSRIVGGSNSSVIYPFNVALFRLEKDLEKPSESLKRLIPDDVKVNKQLCSGILLNEEYVLSTAVCAGMFSFKNDKESLNVSVGSNDLVELFDTSREIEKVIMHPGFKYDPKLMLPINDLALIKLSQKIQFDDKISPACLGSQKIKEYFDALTVIGHGHDKVFKSILYDKQPNRLPRVRYLKEATVLDISPVESKCKSRSGFICIKGRNLYDSVCDGDSGSPVLNQKNGRTSVVGLVSVPGVKIDYQEGTVLGCHGSVTSIVTRLSENFDWIEQHIQKNYCDVRNI